MGPLYSPVRRVFRTCPISSVTISIIEDWSLLGLQVVVLFSDRYFILRWVIVFLVCWLYTSLYPFRMSPLLLTFFDLCFLVCDTETHPLQVVRFDWIPLSITFSNGINIGGGFSSMFYKVGVFRGGTKEDSRILHQTSYVYK